MIKLINTFFEFMLQNKLIFLLILFFYVLLPTNNSSLDSFAYAGYIKYNHYLFTPHHLVSNAFIYVLLYPLKQIGINVDVLYFSKIINSIFQLLNLIIFYKLLAYLKIDKKERLLYILILAFSFSLWRYGTENETYIIPIAFSLLASFYFLKSFKKPRINHFIFLSSFCGVIACLFHQIHFFWWLGILIGFFFLRKKVLTIIYYGIPTLLVPISYILVLVFYESKELTIYNLTHFVFNDFYQGSVATNFGWKGIFFQLLNTVRTYFQIHPTIYILIKKNLLYIIPLITVLCLIYLAVKEALKNKIFYKRERRLSLFINIHIFIFVLNYLFAFYNYGNIEFMVMLPCILVLCIAIKYNVNNRLLKLLSLILLIWNFSYAIFPNHYYNYFNDEKLVEFMIEHPEKTFIINNAATRNQYFYKTGISNPKNILLLDKMSTSKIDSILYYKKKIFTDVIDKPELLNKKKMTSNTDNSLLNVYARDTVFSYTGFYGKSTVYTISNVK